MGIDFIITIENKSNRTKSEVDKFLEGEWELFTWRSKKYATMLHTPRAFGVAWGQTWDYLPRWERIEWECLRQEIYKAWEFFGKGKVYVGDDLFRKAIPDNEDDEEFSLPCELDKEMLFPPDYRKYPELKYVKEKKVCTQWLIPYKKVSREILRQEKERVSDELEWLIHGLFIPTLSRFIAKHKLKIRTIISWNDHHEHELSAVYSGKKICIRIRFRYHWFEDDLYKFFKDVSRELRFLNLDYEYLLLIIGVKEFENKSILRDLRKKNCYVSVYQSEDMLMRMFKPLPPYPAKLNSLICYPVELFLKIANKESK